MILKNIDHLFAKPHMSASINFNYYMKLRKKTFKNWDNKEIQITSSYALFKEELDTKTEHFSGGFLVIKPSKELFNNLINFMINLDLSQLPEYVLTIHEEVILNLYYSNWQQ